MKRFCVKTEVYFDSGALEYLTLLDNRRALVITDPFMVQAGFADTLIHILKTSVEDYRLFTGVQPDPPVEAVAAGVKEYLAFRPDLIIALGGGSTIDAAKSILLFARQHAGNADDGGKPLFIAIPTTSGTGSEVTSYSVMTLGDTKIPLVSQDIIPDVAILDAAFLRTVPPQITADTAIDALTHAIEAYVSSEHSDYTDALCEKTVELIFDYLLRAYRSGDDLEARERLHNASCLAGMAFTNAALGITHSMAHTLGGHFHLPHGRANAVLLPHIIEYNADLESGGESRAATRYCKLARRLHLPASTVAEGVASLVSAVRALQKLTGTPASLEAAGIDREAYEALLPALSQAALKDKCTAANPREVNVQQLEQLFRKVY
ncbi:iron-containing alcohol dehydrogenase [Paenibacillus macerans]|uniref:Iron-containing alcohol dehydrogenase n=1 Tax=Paenibacillus macerans TaxID=44252 RepID=A0A6N8EUH8_PAEMA|nr:1-propanol dehydrogenase PduQ [Paenibacillus macerans]MUG21928.1 iron-containing alcohol dehydrogenase [Paenibacillus macerans]